MKSKSNKCIDCKYYAEYCNHPSNRGVIIRSRQEYYGLLKTSKELNRQGKCTNYETI